MRNLQGHLPACRRLLFQKWEEIGDISKQATGAPNGSVPQNICSTGKFLLAGRL